MYFTKYGSGYPIVFLHGWGCDGSIFLPIAERLVQNTCYVVDLPGFGKSELPPPEGWKVEDFADALFCFFRQNNLQEALIVGHSFGCRVAIVFAALHPECVSSMFFAAPAGLRRPSFKRWWRVRAYKLSKLFGSGKAHNASQDYLDSGLLKNTFVKVVNENLAHYAKRISCPVLIVNGKQDTATPLWHAKKLHKLIAHSTLVQVDGDHFAVFRSPVAFAEAIKNFSE